VKRRARLISAAALGGLATIVVGVGLTWACTPPTFGTPAAPNSAPPPDETSSGPAGPTAQGGPSPAGPGAVSPTTGSSGEGSTSGARAPSRSTGQAPDTSGAPARGVVRRSAPVAPATGVANSQSGVADSQFAQRANGATAGVTARGGRTVFASPAAKGTGSGRESKASDATPSARSASGDLWSGFKPQARSSVFAAEAAGANQGSGAPMTAALVVLGLGLVGLVGSASVLGLRRRRAEANATARSSSGSTEM